MINQITDINTKVPCAHLSDGSACERVVHHVGSAWSDSMMLLSSQRAQKRSTPQKLQCSRLVLGPSNERCEQSSLAVSWDSKVSSNAAIKPFSEERKLVQSDLQEMSDLQGYRTHPRSFWPLMLATYNLRWTRTNETKTKYDHSHTRQQSERHWTELVKSGGYTVRAALTSTA